jgi:hypothetical protein
LIPTVPDSSPPPIRLPLTFWGLGFVSARALPAASATTTSAAAALASLAALSDFTAALLRRPRTGRTIPSPEYPQARRNART